MGVAVISMDAVCIFMLLTILYGCIFETHTKRPKNNQYTACVVVTLVLLISDLLAWACGISGKCGDRLLFVLNLLPLAVGPWIAVMFIGYMAACINEKQKFSNWYCYAAVIFNVCGTAFLIAGSCLGHVFTIENGVFLAGDWYFVSRHYTLATMVYIGLLALRCSKALGRHDTTIGIIYLLLPVLAQLTEIWFPRLGLIYPAAAISVVAVYVLMQVSEVNAFRMQEQILREASHNDPLSGLLSRRAYDERLASLRPAARVGVVFCDLNGLKFVNDHFGHKAGDELIVSFAKMLAKHFRQEDIYRISGDEFVALIDGVGDGMFYQRVNALREENEEKNEPAAIGIQHGYGSEILNLLKKAEKEMQEDKKSFYRKNPQYFKT